MIALFGVIYFLGVMSIWWGVIGVFDSKPERDQGKYDFLRFINFLFWIVSAYLLYQYSSENFWIQVISITFALLGLGLFWLTCQTIRKHHFSLVFSKDAPVVLVTSGPYKYVRNPFYLAYLMIYLSAILMTGSFLLVGIYGVIILLYIHAAQSEEKKFASSTISEEYAAYKQRVGRFLPWF